MSTVDFARECLETQENKLRLHYGAQFDGIREELLRQQESMRRDPDLPTAAVGETFVSNWSSCRLKYPLVYELAAGFATVFPGNADVERDFAIMKWLYSEQRPNLCLASIVGTIICRQLERLRAYKPVADRLRDAQPSGWETLDE
eukprot:GHVU01211173.1.p2 GENE.GHVU01211173.1~~GHVU01211173.1.p2  ORF type:complete len:145 (-),score=21.56 GHVU01211173.1:827-1261(-)